MRQITNNYEFYLTKILIWLPAVISSFFGIWTYFSTLSFLSLSVFSFLTITPIYILRKRTFYKGKTGIFIFNILYLNIVIVPMLLFSPFDTVNFLYRTGYVYFFSIGAFLILLLSCLGFWCINNFSKVSGGPKKQILLLGLITILVFPLFIDGFKILSRWDYSISYDQTNLSDLEFSRTVELAENLEFSSIFAYNSIMGPGTTMGQIRDYIVKIVNDPVKRLFNFPFLSRSFSYHLRSTFSETGINIHINNSTNLGNIGFKQVSFQNSSSLEFLINLESPDEMIFVNETHYISEGDEFIISITEPVFVVSVDISYTTQNEHPMSPSFGQFNDDYWIIAFENLSVAIVCWGFVYHE